MERSELVEKLETVAPALAVTDIVPITAHFWFTGKTVMAYNGHVAISVPFETDFSCAVPGILLSLLKASSAKKIEVNCDKAFRVKGARTKIELPILSADLFAFKMPKPPQAPIAARSSDFLNAVAVCMRSVSNDGSIPDQLGITVLPSNHGVTMFSTNGVTMSRARVKFREAPAFDRVVVRALFAKQLLAFAKNEKKLRLELRKDMCMYAGSDGTVMYGQPVLVEKPLRFVEVFDKFHPKENDARMVELAPRLAAILDRAAVVAQGDPKPARTKITVKAGVASFVTEASVVAARVEDAMPLAEGHPDVFIEVSAKAMRAGCDDFNRFMITKNCVVMANDYAHYMIAGRDA